MPALQKAVLIAAALTTTSTGAIVDCYDDIYDLTPKANAIVIATIQSTGWRDTTPCPEPEPGVFYPNTVSCGRRQTLELRIDKCLKGSTAPIVSATLPGSLFNLPCDGSPPTIRVGAQIGLFLKSEPDGYWVLSGDAGVFHADDWFQAQVKAAMSIKRR